MSSFTAVDLSKLPSPAILDVPEFETIFAEMLARLKTIDPAFDALVESDPLYKILQVAAYFRLIDRQRVNDAARGVMLAYAVGTDLDHLGALVGVARLVIEAGDPPTMESDADFRRRVQLAPEGFSTAGPAGAYVFHALGADPEIADAAAVSDTPGVVEIFVLARSEGGVPSEDAIAAVQAALSADNVRPLTDQVIVSAVDVVPYTVEAELEVYPGPDSALVRQASQSATEAYVTAQRRIGLPVTRSGLFATLHGAGVRNVNLIQPAADIDVTDRQVAVCTGVSVEIA